MLFSPVLLIQTQYHFAKSDIKFDFFASLRKHLYKIIYYHLSTSLAGNFLYCLKKEGYVYDEREWEKEAHRDN